MQKLIGICVMLCFLTLPAVVIIAPMLKSQPLALNSLVIGQDTAEVGELCRFLSEGEIVRWDCLPKTKDSESYGSHNENYVVSFRKPGTYTIIAAVYIEGDLEIHTQEVVVGGSTQIIDPLPPPGPVNELSQRVAGWVQRYQVDRDSCLSLARNFSQVASMIQSGQLTTVEEIIIETANLNRSVNPDENLMAEIQAYLTSQSDAGLLSTPDQHMLVWQSIATGLSNAVTP